MFGCKWLGHELKVLYDYLIWVMSLLHNDSRTQPLDSVAVWNRRLNSLFPIQPLLTFIYINVSCGLIQAKFRVKSLKNGLSINSGRSCRFATTSEDCA